MNILFEEFYHNKNGIFTNKYENLGNCISRNVFFILRHLLYKHNPQKVNDLYKIYLQDLNFCLYIDTNDNIISIDTNDNMNWEKFLINVDSIKFNKNGKKAIEKLDDLLNKEEIVLVCTKEKKIKFHKSLVLNIEDDIKNDRDFYFLILGNKNNLIYYLYSYNLYDKDYFKACVENPSIGIAPKVDFYEAFDDYVELITLTADFKPLDDVILNVLDIINKNIENYFGNYNSNTSLLQGRSGLEFLLQKIRNDGLLFNLVYDDTIEIKNKLSFESLRHTLSLLIRRRKQYINMFEILGIQDEMIIVTLITKLNDSILNWEILMNYIKYLFFKKDCRIGLKGATFIENILKSDDDLFTYMKDNHSYIYTSICYN